MTKHKRIVITLEPNILRFIDDVCRKVNDDPETQARDKLTRSHFIELCVIAYYDAVKATATPKQAAN